MSYGRPRAVAVRDDVDLPLPVRTVDDRAGLPDRVAADRRGTAAGRPEYLRLTRFFGTLLVINIAVGVVTGLVQEFQFGMNWSAYSRFVGDVFGAPLAMEGLAAFFLESVFLGLWLFGWDRLAKRVHLATIWAVALGVVAVGRVHHGRQLVDAAPGRLRDQPDHRAGPAHRHLGGADQPGLRLGLPARAAGLAGHRGRGHARRLRLAPAAPVQPGGVRALGPPGR